MAGNRLRILRISIKFGSAKKNNLQTLVRCAEVLILLAVLLVGCLFMGTVAKSEESRTFVSTEDWQPPEIDEEDALNNEPWMLVLKIAQEEIGYVEGPHEDESKYGEWMGDRLTAWCAEFLTWCVNEADERYGSSLMNTVYPYYAHPKDGAPWFLQRERFVTSTSAVPVSREKMWLAGSDHYLKNKEYIPYPGDYLWVSYYDPKKGTDHVAIVEGVSQEPDGSYLIHVIEGNNPDRVQRNTYAQTWKLIYGYGTPVRRANRAIKVYNRGNDCEPIQVYLAELGYMEEKDINPQFLPAGEKALRKYQKEHGIKNTGKVDLATRTVMEEDPRFLELINQYQK